MYDARLDPIYDLLSERYSVEDVNADKNSAEFVIAWYDLNNLRKECQLEIHLDFDDNSMTSGAVIVFSRAVEEETIEYYNGQDEKY